MSEVTLTVQLSEMMVIKVYYNSMQQNRSEYDTQWDKDKSSSNQQNGNNNSSSEGHKWEEADGAAVHWALVGDSHVRYIFEVLVRRLVDHVPLQYRIGSHKVYTPLTSNSTSYMIERS